MTPYVDQHMGGEAILRNAGRDSSAGFHGGFTLSELTSRSTSWQSEPIVVGILHWRAQRGIKSQTEPSVRCRILVEEILIHPEKFT